MANPFPFVSGAVLEAAQLNGIGEAWTSYTPVIKGGATTVTATIQYAKYARVNKVLFVRVEATVTSAGAANGIVTITLPIAAAGTNSSSSNVGTFFILDSGTAFYAGAAILNGVGLLSGTAYGAADFMGASTPAMTLANNDKIAFSVCYEVA